MCSVRVWITRCAIDGSHAELTAAHSKIFDLQAELGTAQTHIQVLQDSINPSRCCARAPLLLKKLDRNGDGRLTPDEYQPTPQTGQPSKADRP